MSSESFRLTPQRRAILDELRKVTSHPTASDLYEAVRARCPNISLGTVYRNLDSMSRQGIIQCIDTAGRQMRFDAEVNAHYHIRCVECGRVDDVADETWEKLERMASDATGYEVLRHSVEFAGICPRCRGQAESR